MRRLFPLFLLFPFISFSQEREASLECNFKTVKLNDSTYKVQVENFESLHAEESCFLSWMNTGKDKPDGILLVFDEKGRKRRKATYKGGIRVGTHLMWYSTGELERETIWETDLYFTTKGYYKSGKIKCIGVNGNRENAVYKSYYENGRLESISNLSNDGDKNWYDDGKPKLERNTKTNAYKEWYQNGQMKIEGKLKNGWTRIGKWSYFNNTGKLVKELFYEDTANNRSWYGDEAGFKTEIKY